MKNFSYNTIIKEFNLKGSIFRSYLLIIKNNGNTLQYKYESIPFDTILEEILTAS
jgi:hypothetical protein